MANKPSRGAPLDHVEPKEAWPDGPFNSQPTKEVRLALGMAKRLQRELDRRKEEFRKEESRRKQPREEQSHEKDFEIAQLARDTGLSRQTIYNILDGRSWANAYTVARLERTLNVPLWGEEHMTRRRYPKQTQRGRPQGPR